ncbi:hypothetical protein Tco_0565462 [Tanacetum coccineum]
MIVEDIPLTFESEEHYFGSFVYLLLEEARTELASSMEIIHTSLFAEILSFSESKCGENMVYDVSVSPWKNPFGERGKDAYQTLPGDLLVLLDGKPESIFDLRRVGRTWALSSVKSNEDDSTSLTIKVKASKPIEFQDGMFAVFVMNTTTQKRIWNSLHIHRNLNIIKEVLYSHSMMYHMTLLIMGKWKQRLAIEAVSSEGRILKILDAPFRLSSSKYEWEDKLPADIDKHCEEMVFQNRVSVRTLAHY